MLGHIIEHEQNRNRGFMLHFCDEGCIIPNIKGLNRCPKGHKGFHERFFPLFATLTSDPIMYSNNSNPRYLNEGLVRVAYNVKKGNVLEYELRRIKNNNEQNFNAIGLLNWSPMYLPIPSENIY